MESAGKVLIVDDNRMNRNLLNDFVTSLGYAAVIAQNGREALEQMEKTPIDIVLLDIMMPEMDGREVLSHMKGTEDSRHIPVIMISSLDDMNTVEACIQQGADDYLSKPFNPIILRARLASALAKKRLHDEQEAHRQEIEAYNLLSLIHI